MVNHLIISRPQISSDDPPIFREIHLHQNVFVIDGTCRGQLNVLRHLDNHVGLDAPAIDELHRRRSIFRIAFNCAAIGPRDQRLDGVVTQSPVIDEVTVVRIRKPRRHLPADYSRLYAFCPGPRVFVGHEGHGSDFTRTMTGLAVLLKNRKNVFIKCYGTGVFPCRRFHRTGHSRNSNCEQSNQGHSSP